MDFLVKHNPHPWRIDPEKYNTVYISSMDEISALPALPRYVTKVVIYGDEIDRIDDEYYYRGDNDTQCNIKQIELTKFNSPVMLPAGLHEFIMSDEFNNDVAIPASVNSIHVKAGFMACIILRNDSNIYDRGSFDQHCGLKLKVANAEQLNIENIAGCRERVAEISIDTRMSLTAPLDLTIFPNLKAVFIKDGFLRPIKKNKTTTVYTI